MTLRAYLILMSAATAIAIGALALILNTVDPMNTAGAVFVVFYACVFLSVTGLLSVIGFSARVFLLGRRQFISQEVSLAFRQAALIATMVCGALLLKGAHKLNWWTGVLLVVIVTLGESFLISGRRRQERQ